jgi:hypothetical protein
VGDRALDMAEPHADQHVDNVTTVLQPKQPEAAESIPRKRTQKDNIAKGLSGGGGGKRVAGAGGAGVSSSAKRAKKSSVKDKRRRSDSDKQGNAETGGVGTYARAQQTHASFPHGSLVSCARVRTTGHEWSHEREQQLADRQWAEMERVAERTRRQDEYAFFQGNFENGQSDSATVDSNILAVAFSVGDSVDVQERQFPGVNKEGGPARIVAVHDDGTYSVKYVLRNTQENHVEACHIGQPANESTSGRRSKRSRTDPSSTDAPRAQSSKAESTCQQAEVMAHGEATETVAVPASAVDGPLDLLLIKRKVAARVYAQDDTRRQQQVGLASPKLFPDWDKFRTDVREMCQPVLDSQPASTAPGSFYREAQRIQDFASSAISLAEQRQQNERTLLGKKARYLRRMERNQLAAMQGEWRKKPFELRQYEPLTR